MKVTIVLGICFVCAAGNQNSPDIIFPANLANDWEDELWAEEINDKEDIDGSSAMANGIVSVGAIYDEGLLIGKRHTDYTYDTDSDGDLELMAPGINIDTTFPTYNNYSEDLNYITASGTSFAAPVVCLSP